MMSYLNKLSGRDRRIVLVTIPVVAVLMVYFLLWRPLSHHRDRLGDLVVQKQYDLVWMQQAAKELKDIKRQAPQKLRPGQSIMALMDQTARQTRLNNALKRVEPDGDDKVRVRLEQAVFDDLVGWIELLNDRYDVVIDNITVDRHETSGVVNARLTFRRR